MTLVVISPIAERDLEDVWLRIAFDNERAATKLVRTLENKIARLRHFPRLGPRRSDLRPSARMLVAGSYLVLYEMKSDTDEGPVDAVEIVRVIDGRRDLARLLKQIR